ncbi:MAG: transporter ATP-binding protein [Subtercola sp.]|nr:transporter ATP-binding protein [Subtercola sp.]
MKVILNRVSKGHDGENLPPASLSYESGAVTLEVVETARRPTVLSLIATGRMAPDAGTVTVDDEFDPTALRTATAIVDAPDVSEPVADLKLTTVVREELMFAERPNSRRAALDALDELNAGEYADYETQNVPPMVRLRILAELAASRPGIEGVVLTSPDRHGGDPFDWWAVASDLALRGLAVLVIASEASVSVVRDVAAQFETDRLAELERQAAARRRAEDDARLAAERDETAEPAEPTTPSPATAAEPAATARATTTITTPTPTTTPSHTSAASDARATSAHQKDLA